MLLLLPKLDPSMLDSILLHACVSMANGLTLESNSCKKMKGQRMMQWTEKAEC